MRKVTRILGCRIGVLEDQTAVILWLLLSACLYKEKRKQHSSAMSHPYFTRERKRGHSRMIRKSRSLREEINKNPAQLKIRPRGPESSAAGVQCCWMHCPEDRDQPLLLEIRESKNGRRGETWKQRERLRNEVREPGGRWKGEQRGVEKT